MRPRLIFHGCICDMRVCRLSLRLSVIDSIIIIFIEIDFDEMVTNAENGAVTQCDTLALLVSH